LTEKSTHSVTMRTNMHYSNVECSGHKFRVELTVTLSRSKERSYRVMIAWQLAYAFQVPK